MFSCDIKQLNDKCYYFQMNISKLFAEDWRCEASCTATYIASLQSMQYVCHCAHIMPTPRAAPARHLMDARRRAPQQPRP